jgi:hypothetical protein
MVPALLLAFVIALTPQSPSQSPQPVQSPELAAKFASLFHTITTTNDDSAEAAARKEIMTIYASRGLPSTTEVGDEPSYEFIVMLESDSIPYDQRIQILEKIKDAAARGEIPADAAVFYAARLRFEHIKQLAAAHPPANPALRDQILSFYKTDQAVRQQQGFDAARMQEVDRDNSASVQKILDQFGVPTFSLVGPDAAGAFILMIQHQPAEFRARVLPQLKANVEAGEADPDSFAKVYDRSQYDLGKPQLYGEQLVCNAGEKLHEAPIEDGSHVNDRRAQLGLIRAEIWTRLAAELMPQFCPPAAPQK